MVLTGDVVIFITIASETIEPELGSFEPLMEFQDECISSRTGCDGPFDVADVFG
jgi:hypothetical protein